jgi:hypothetical protein
MSSRRRHASERMKGYWRAVREGWAPSAAREDWVPVGTAALTQAAHDARRNAPPAVAAVALDRRREIASSRIAGTGEQGAGNMNAEGDRSACAPGSGGGDRDHRPLVARADAEPIQLVRAAARSTPRSPGAPTANELAVGILLMQTAVSRVGNALPSAKTTSADRWPNPPSPPPSRAARGRGGGSSPCRVGRPQMPTATLDPHAALRAGPDDGEARRDRPCETVDVSSREPP